MNANKIRETIASRAQAAGLDPSGPLGYADLLGFGKRYNSRGRVGILGVPESLVEDKETFFSNPLAQIDAGIELLRQEKERQGNDFGALLNYTKDPATTVRSMIRGAKYSGQTLTPNMIMQAAKAANVEIDPFDEAKKAGVQLRQDAQPQQQVAQTQPQMNDNMQQAPADLQIASADEMSFEMAEESTEEQRKSRLRQAFGAKDKTSGLSDELNTYLRKMI